MVLDDVFESTMIHRQQLIVAIHNRCNCCDFEATKRTPSVLLSTLLTM